mmetsp:Transcript_23239/g.80987  ORF Transcript_23239/g.80987 Transcript_23239/m.80987 type:complete len:248 (-) Transcript_23239:1716-2459(-)
MSSCTRTAAAAGCGGQSAGQLNSSSPPPRLQIRSSLHRSAPPPASSQHEASPSQSGQSTQLSLASHSSSKLHGTSQPSSGHARCVSAPSHTPLSLHGQSLGQLAWFSGGYQSPLSGAMRFRPHTPSKSHGQSDGQSLKLSCAEQTPSGKHVQSARQLTYVSRGESQLPSALQGQSAAQLSNVSPASVSQIPSTKQAQSLGQRRVLSPPHTCATTSSSSQSLGCSFSHSVHAAWHAGSSVVTRSHSKS